MKFILRAFLLSMMVFLTVRGFAQQFAFEKVAKEHSKYGTFSMVQKGYNYNIQFRRTGGSPVSLFAEDIPVAILPETQIGTTIMPFLASDGQEFHLFSFNQMGNSCEGSQFHVLIITSNKMWVTPAPFGGCETIENIKVIENTGTSRVSFTVPPTKTSEGKIYVASMGKLETSLISKMPSSLKNNKIEQWTGIIRDGYHASNWIPVLEVGKKIITFSSQGQCQLESFVGKKAKIKAEVKTWSDGRREVTCVSVEPIENQAHSIDGLGTNSAISVDEKNQIFDNLVNSMANSAALEITMTVAPQYASNELTQALKKAKLKEADARADIKIKKLILDPYFKSLIKERIKRNDALLDTYSPLQISELDPGQQRAYLVIGQVRARLNQLLGN